MQTTSRRINCIWRNCKREGSFTADARLVNGVQRTYTLALEAIAVGRNLSGVIERHGFGETVDLERLVAEGEFDVWSAIPTLRI